jgi:membrane protease YdiL (CAAX protease family)
MISLLSFFAMAYAITWACFVTVAAAGLSGPVSALLVLAGAFAPAMASLALTARSEGMAGIRALVERAAQWDVPLRWYAFALLYTVAVKLTAALLYRAATGGWPRFGNDPWYLIPFAIAISTPFQAGEEIGWRGYALPRMAARMGLRRASLLLGMVWALWHLPQFWIRQGDTYGQSFPLFAVQVVAMSVAIAWLWAKTGGSLFLTMLLHAAVNNSKDVVPSGEPGATHVFGLSHSPIAWLTAAILWVCAAYFLARMPGKERSRPDYFAANS